MDLLTLVGLSIAVLGAMGATAHTVFVVGGRVARIEVKLEALEKAAEKLEQSKASKESHDNLCERLDEMRADINALRIEVVGKLGDLERAWRGDTNPGKRGA